MQPILAESDRLVIRAFQSMDLNALHRILDLTFGDGSKIDDPEALAERASWLQWSILSHKWYPALYQPHYGERAIVLKSSGELIGAIGLVPCLDSFEQLPSLNTGRVPPGYRSAEVGLFWAIDPAHQRRGYASEAARALIDYAFRELKLMRIIATTEYDNLASQAVMRKVGMRIERNPLSEPPWLQVVGILEQQVDGSEA